MLSLCRVVYVVCVGDGLGVLAVLIGGLDRVLVVPIAGEQSVLCV